MSNIRQVLIEGFSPDEISALPDQEIETLVLVNEPIVFKVGSAEVLGRFCVEPNTLVMELAQIDGGGEGVLLTLWLLAGRYARRQGLAQIEWRVHAVNCAKPNLKLRRVLEKRGFTIEDVPESGQIYRLVDSVAGRPS